MRRASQKIVVTSLAVLGLGLSARAQKDPAEPGAQELRIRGMQEEVNQVKESILRAKERIRRMQEILVTDALGAGCGLVLVHRNELGGAFRLLQVRYLLDGRPVFTRSGEELEGVGEARILARPFDPGFHVLKVEYDLQGAGYGMFPYMEGYRFRLRSTYTFRLEEGKLLRIQVVGFERDVLTNRLRDRPSVRYELTVDRMTVERARELLREAGQPG